MQIRDNIIQFESKHQDFSNVQAESDAKTTGKVITLEEKKLFKNAFLVDILKDDFSPVDILVEKGKIKKIAPCGEIKKSPEMEVHDLEENFVLPPFCNYYARSDSLLEAIRPSKENDKNFLKLFFEAHRMSNFLEGNALVNDVGANDALVLENILDYDEKALEAFSDKVAKKNRVVFLHVGLTLEELGSVEKKFGKPLVQVLEDFGFLDRPWILVGGNCLEKDDFQLLSQYGGAVVVCPLEDAVVGRRTLNLQMLKNLGIDVVLGSGQSLDVNMLDAVKQLLFAQRTLFESAHALAETEAFWMATGEKSTLKENDDANFIVMRNMPTLRKSLISFLIWESSKFGALMTVAEGNVLQTDGFIYNYDLDMNFFEVLEKLNEMKEKQKNDD